MAEQSRNFTVEDYLDAYTAHRTAVVEMMRPDEPQLLERRRRIAGALETESGSSALSGLLAKDPKAAATYERDVLEMTGAAMSRQEISERFNGAFFGEGEQAVEKKARAFQDKPGLFLAMRERHTRLTEQPDADADEIHVMSEVVKSASRKLVETDHQDLFELALRDPKAATMAVVYADKDGGASDLGEERRDMAARAAKNLATFEENLEQGNFVTAERARTALHAAEHKIAGDPKAIVAFGEAVASEPRLAGREERASIVVARAGDPARLVPAERADVAKKLQAAMRQEMGDDYDDPVRRLSYLQKIERASRDQKSGLFTLKNEIAAQLHHTVGEINGSVKHLGRLHQSDPDMADALIERRDSRGAMLRDKPEIQETIEERRRQNQQKEGGGQQAGAGQGAQKEDPQAAGQGAGSPGSSPASAAQQLSKQISQRSSAQVQDNQEMVALIEQDFLVDDNSKLTSRFSTRAGDEGPLALALPLNSFSGGGVVHKRLAKWAKANPDAAKELYKRCITARDALVDEDGFGRSENLKRAYDEMEMGRRGLARAMLKVKTRGFSEDMSSQDFREFQSLQGKSLRPELRNLTREDLQRQAASEMSRGGKGKGKVLPSFAHLAGIAARSYQEADRLVD